MLIAIISPAQSHRVQKPFSVPYTLVSKSSLVTAMPIPASKSRVLCFSMRNNNSATSSRTPRSETMSAIARNSAVEQRRLNAPQM